MVRAWRDSVPKLFLRIQDETLLVLVVLVRKGFILQRGVRRFFYAVLLTGFPPPHWSFHPIRLSGLIC
jgi:hypothetical protein